MVVQNLEPACTSGNPMSLAASGQNLIGIRAVGGASNIQQWQIIWRLHGNSRISFMARYFKGSIPQIADVCQARRNAWLLYRGFRRGPPLPRGGRQPGGSVLRRLGFAAARVCGGSSSRRLKLAAAQ